MLCCYFCFDGFSCDCFVLVVVVIVVVVVGLLLLGCCCCCGGVVGLLLVGVSLVVVGWLLDRFSMYCLCI